MYDHQRSAHAAIFLPQISELIAFVIMATSTWSTSCIRAATIRGQVLFPSMSSRCSYYSGCGFYSNKYSNCNTLKDTLDCEFQENLQFAMIGNLTYGTIICEMYVLEILVWKYFCSYKIRAIYSPYILILVKNVSVKVCHFAHNEKFLTFLWDAHMSITKPDAGPRTSGELP